MIYKIIPSIDPDCNVAYYVFAETEDEAIIKAKKEFNLADSEVSKYYRDSRFADCFSCDTTEYGLEGHITEPYVLRMIREKTDGYVAYLDMENKIHETNH